MNWLEGRKAIAFHITDTSDWNDAPENRPSKADFDPWHGCLDALTAWRNFGGLSRAEAYEKFRSSPDVFQEDFAFMGGLAFIYYYPVLERYILESSVANNQGNDVEAMWILAHCIRAHVEANQVDYALGDRILALVTHVRNNLPSYSVDPHEQCSMDTAWGDLDLVLRGLKRSI